MSIPRLLLAVLLFSLLIAAHAFLHIQLVSLIIAPLALAIWFSFVPEPREWIFFLLILATELLSSAPPGAMTLAIALPLAARNVFPSIPARLSIRFLVLTMAITGGQLTILMLFMLYKMGVAALPWPALLYATIGTGVAAFITAGVWQELSAYDERA